MLKHSRLIGIAVLAIILAGPVQNSSNGAGFDIKAGAGYDFLSQQYYLLEFLDSDTSGALDSLLSLKRTYLDDLKGVVTVNYSPGRGDKWQLYSHYEQTDKFIRLRLNNDLRLKLKSSRLRLAGEVDWRHRLVDTTEFGDSYLFGQGSARLAIPVNESVGARIQLSGEVMDFKSRSTFSFDYYRTGAKAGLTKSFENFSYLDGNLFVQARQVTDSTELNYLSLGVESSFLGLYGTGELDFYFRLEDREYNQPLSKNDHYRIELEGRNRLRLGDRFFTKQEAELELVRYDPEDIINFGYDRVALTLLAGYKWGRTGIAVGPALEWLDERQEDSAFADDYFEAGGRVDLDYFDMGRLFLTAESILGVRDRKFEHSEQTDYLFERVSLIADLRMFGHLNLSLYFSAEWEWHESTEENARLLLTSSSLTWSF